MKVAILFDNFGPYHLARLIGASRVVEVLGVEFAGSSHDYVWERSEASHTLRTETLFPESSSRQVATRDFKDRLTKVLEDFAPDAVAIPGWSGRGAFLALEWCGKNKVPAIVMSESTAHDEVRSHWREWIKRQYVGQCAAALVGGCPHQKYMQDLGMAPERIQQGYDAVDNHYFKEKAESIKLEHASSEGHAFPGNYFLVSARFIEKKNLFRVLDAYASYSHASDNLTSARWPLVMLGDGELKSQLLAHCAKLGLNVVVGAPWESSATTDSSNLTSGTVFFPGFRQIDELPLFYAHAGTFIHASTTEQWGLVVNEAMACGLPVIVSKRVGCADDLVQEGVNGFTFDPYDVDALSGLMSRISSLPSEKLTEMGRHSEEMISSWGPERFGAGLKAAVDKALELGPIKPTILQRAVLTVLARR